MKITNDDQYETAVDYLRAVQKIEVRDMSRAMFKFLRSKANAVYRYLHDVCVTDCNAEFINRFLFRLAAADYIDPRSYRLIERIHKKEWDEKSAKEAQLWRTVDLENF
jgi:hypothetical protein